MDGDGETVILLAECQLPSLGERYGIFHDGRVAICEGPDWEPEVLHDDFYCPHTLQAADFGGEGNLDIYVAESDYGWFNNPRHFIYENNGDGTFEEHLIHEGVAPHQARSSCITAVIDASG